MTVSAELLEFFDESFERPLFVACLNNFNTRGNPLRFNNFATSIRELIRHALRRLAPDANVQDCSWYENVTKKEGIIARGERITYALQGGLDDEFVEKTLGLNVGRLKKNLIDAIDELSKYTHVGPETFDLSDEECDQRAAAALAALEAFRKSISSSKSAVVEAIGEKLEDSIVGEVLADSLDAVGELATHFTVEEVYVHGLRITSIDDQFIHAHASGSLSVGLQWGSNSDLRNDLGAEGEESFPLEVDLTVDLNDLKKNRWSSRRFGLIPPPGVPTTTTNASMSRKNELGV